VSNNLDFALASVLRWSGLGRTEIEREITALLVIDPYNDFISEGGKF